MTFVKYPIKPFNSHDRWLQIDMERPLSGYLAGKRRGGYSVCKLEDEWARTFHVKHAIACNSATSGLLAASFAIDLRPGDTFLAPAMTMSATIAAPAFTGAIPMFGDVNDEDFSLVSTPMPDSTKAIFTTSLFGHPSRLSRNQWHVYPKNPVYLIEDNAQSPFAMANGYFAGTVGTIGVFSLNVHKPLQCGEGGIVVTNDDALAERMRDFINHGENAGGNIGLNLRMPELCAAVALSQLRRGPEIIEGRVAQAKAILAAIGDIAGIRPPITHAGCSHVYYTIPFLTDINGGRFPPLLRLSFCRSLRERGVPIVEGYTLPCCLPAFTLFATEDYPVAQDLHHNRLFYIENCAWDFTEDQIKQIGAAFREAAKENGL